MLQSRINTSEPLISSNANDNPEKNDRRKKS